MRLCLLAPALLLALPFRPALGQDLGGAPVFSDIGAGLPGVSGSALAWGDYDGDGDLDLAVSGLGNSLHIAGVYRNTGGAFADAGAGLTGVNQSALAWGDYDGDGDLDLAVSGQPSSGPDITRVYRNDSGAFAVAANLTGVRDGTLAWGDYDGDGDLDLALTGQLSTGPSITRVYRNDDGAFADAEIGLPAVSSGALAWGDYDGDGDLDLALSGYVPPGLTTRVYQNTGGAFAVATGVELIGVYQGELAWGDYDGDGRLDLALSGNADFGFAPITRVYRNTGTEGAVFALAAELSGVIGGGLAWGDYDGDGRLDLALSGTTDGGGRIAQVYRNDPGAVGGFVDAGAGLPGVSGSALAWGDYDGDGALDLALSGNPGSGGVITRVYQNTGGTVNTAPSAPAGLAASASGLAATLSWAPASDDTTPTPALTYNVWIEAPDGTRFLAPPMALAAGTPAGSGAADDGMRLVPAFGNAGARLEHTIRLPRGGTYRWSVQAVDAGFAGSPFAAAGTFEIEWFEDAGFVLPGLNDSALAWGDYDGDGDLDLAMSGFDDSFSNLTRVYRNDDGAFVDALAGLPGVSSGALAWGDYDGDGDLDLALNGSTGSAYITQVYRNENGVFVDALAGLPGVSSGALAWGDYDGDGDLDLALSGVLYIYPIFERITRVYRNDNGAFTDAEIGLPAVSSDALAWGDYDGDGDLDLALSGSTSSAYITRVYRNDDGVFVDALAGLPGVSSGALAWGDYDGDGRLDLALSGYLGAGRIAEVWQNTGGPFALAAEFTGVSIGEVAWGDYDGDGDLDLAMSGSITGSETIAGVHRNDEGTFASAAEIELTGVTRGALVWGDYDGDGHLDLAMSGNVFYPGTNYITRLYRNTDGTASTAPATPAGLTASVSGDAVTLSWAAATDDTTPAAVLTYNVWVEDPDGTRFVAPPMALAAGTPVDPGTADDGDRLVPAFGNAGARLSYTVRGLPRTGAYRWSVQAIDAGFAGSPFATAGSFISETPREVLRLAGAPGWRMLAPPRSGLTYDDLLGGLWTQGFPNSDAPGTPGAPVECSAYVFDETVRTDTDGDGAVTLHDGWACLPDQDDEWAVGTGLMVYVYADDDADGTVTPAEAFPKTIPLASPVAVAPFSSFALSFTDDPGVPHSQEGWNLVGNPLPFAFDWDLAERAPLLDATLYLYDPAFNGGDYRTHTAGGAGDLGGGAVPPGQGFFVKGNGLDPALTLSIPPGAITAADPLLYARTANRGASDIGETPGTPGPADGPPQVLVAVGGEGGAPPLALALADVRPNPLRGAASVAYALPTAGPVRLALYDVLGRAVAVLHDGDQPAGRHEARFDGAALAPGVYVLHLETAAGAVSRRVTVVR